MREIVLDTETTGLDFKEDRIFEIGCIELLDKLPTGNKLQVYINPGRGLSDGARKISGIQDKFLLDKPKFLDIAYELLDFLGNSPIIAHNAEFDTTFINKELELIGKPKLSNKIIDSLAIAKKIFPNKKNNLDALCKRLKVDNHHREFHGALLDADLTCQVYYILCHLQVDNEEFQLEKKKEQILTNNSFPERIFQVSQEELDKHIALIKQIQSSIK